MHWLPHETITPRSPRRGGGGGGHDLIVTVTESVRLTRRSRAPSNPAATPFHPVIECEFFAVALNLVIDGAGIGFVDALSVSETLRRTGNAAALVVRPFAPATFYEVGVLKPTIGELSVLAQQFVKLLDDHVAPHLVQS